uniref:Uncharacterized protein n=1 Tax=Leersia perrieri TaxID=77586 RepID=A0A0D9X8F0_9ORYZ
MAAPHTTESGISSSFHSPHPTQYLGCNCVVLHGYIPLSSAPPSVKFFFGWPSDEDYTPMSADTGMDSPPLPCVPSGMRWKAWITYSSCNNVQLVWAALDLNEHIISNLSFDQLWTSAHAIHKGTPIVV